MQVPTRVTTAKASLPGTEAPAGVTEETPGEGSLLTEVFEALPAPTFLVDGDVVVQLANRAARALVGVADGEQVPANRGGELLRCVHATEHPEGCGRATACRTCVVRCAVREAVTTGAVTRQKVRMELRCATGEGTSWLTVLVSVAPVELGALRLAILTIEDVGELLRPRTTAGPGEEPGRQGERSARA